MAETPRLALPLLEAGQAQKHVVVNESLARIDALSAASVASRRLDEPPPTASEGAAWIVGPGARGAWAGRSGQLAAWLNSGWVFVAPEAGRRVWIDDEAAEWLFDGSNWRPGCRAGRLGAAATLSVVTLDHALSEGATSLTAPAIPDKAVAIGVTARVLTSLAGPGLTAWRLGVPGAPGRYGGGYGLAAGSYAVGLTSAPLAYFGDTPLLIEAEAGSFEAGAIRLAVHLLTLEPPL